MSMENPMGEGKQEEVEKDFREMPDGTMMDATGKSEEEINEERQAYRNN